MEAKQINVKIPKNLLKSAESYAKNFGFRNVQDLLIASTREKIFDKSEFDDSFTQKEIQLIDKVIAKILQEKDFVTEEKLMATLRK